MVIQGYVTSLICKSRAGLGKTQTTIQMLKEDKTEFHYINSYSTPLALYKTLYQHNGKIIVLDDMEMIFDNDISISILKSALWDVDGERKVTYNSTTTRLTEVPSSFIFTGRIVMLVNEIKAKKSPSFEALLSRTLNVEISYSFEETKAMAFDIINKRVSDVDQRVRIMDIINRCIAPFHDFNFRLLDRLITFVRYDTTEAEQLFMNTLSVDDDNKLVWSLLTQDITIDEQIQQFTAKTGKSRTTFYKIRKRIKEEYGE
jgi:hypothetical protein